MKVLVCGGAGFIGSHLCMALLESGNDVCVIDNLSTSKIDMLNRVEQLMKIGIQKYYHDLSDYCENTRVLDKFQPEVVFHLAGYKSISESQSNPCKYYENNLMCTMSLVKSMRDVGVRHMVFSSSASVYSAAAVSPIAEDELISPISPYGRTKQISELILEDMCKSEANWNIALLRYFNPIGAHNSGLLGEMNMERLSNIMPALINVAGGVERELQVYGNDYETADGTCIRDYIHIMDLVEGHIRALYLSKPNDGVSKINLGTGYGVSVLQLIRAFEEATGKKIPYRFAARRSGDRAVVFANVDRARQLLGWKAKRSIHDMCIDAWRFHVKNKQ